MLQGLSSLSCTDTLYKSMIEMSSDTWLTSQGIKNFVVKPPIFLKFELRSKILLIGTIEIHNFEHEMMDSIDQKSSYFWRIAKVRNWQILRIRYHKN